MKLRNIFSIALIASVFLHLSTFIAVKVSEWNRKNQTKDTSIEIEILDPAKFSAKKMQIVDQNSKPLNDEVSDKAKFLSQFNQAVVKESKAANTGVFKNEAGQGLMKKGSSEVSENKKSVTKKSKSNFTETGTLSVQEKFSPKMNWTNLAKKNEALGVQNPGDISKTADYLKDVQEGPQTILNTREFVYYSYYSRIKSQIQQYWEPKIKEKVRNLFMQGRQIASNKDRITKLLIVLNEKGTLVGVQVMGESGIEDLDDAAIEAFRAAAPFPNPPAGIVEKDGKIKIQWDFVLEV